MQKMVSNYWTVSESNISSEANAQKWQQNMSATSFYPVQWQFLLRLNSWYQPSTWSFQPFENNMTKTFINWSTSDIRRWSLSIWYVAIVRAVMLLSTKDFTFDIIVGYQKPFLVKTTYRKCQNDSFQLQQKNYTIKSSICCIKKPTLWI